MAFTEVAGVMAVLPAAEEEVVEDCAEAENANSRGRKGIRV